MLCLLCMLVSIRFEELLIGVHRLMIMMYVMDDRRVALIVLLNAVDVEIHVDGRSIELWEDRS